MFNKVLAIALVLLPTIAQAQVFGPDATSVVQKSLPAVPVTTPLTGSGVAGTVQAATSTLVLPNGTNLGTPSAGVLTNATGLPPSGLTTAVTTVNTVPCTLGGACTVTATATSITPGTTTVSGATSPCVITNTSTTTMGCATAGPGIVIGPTLSTSASDSTKTSNYTLGASDMNGQINFNGTSLTVTIPAISGSVFANGMTAIICNYASTGLTIASTPAINGYTLTSLPPVAGGVASCLGLVSNGTSLDATPSVTAGGSVTSATNSDGTLTISPNTGAVVASIALGHANTWTGTQTFNVIGGYLANVQAAKTGAYTLVSSDCGTEIPVAVSSTVAITLPATLPNGCQVAIVQTGTAKVTLVAGASATLQSPHSYTGTFAEYSTIGAQVISGGGGAAVWTFLGDGS